MKPLGPDQKKLVGGAVSAVPVANMFSAFPEHIGALLLSVGTSGVESTVTKVVLKFVHVIPSALSETVTV
jgi:hypothetical protein